MTIPKLDQNTLIPIGVMAALIVTAVTATFTFTNDRAEFKADLRAGAAVAAEQAVKLQELRDSSRDLERRIRMVEEAKILTAESLKRIERALKIEQ